MTPRETTKLTMKRPPTCAKRRREMRAWATVTTTTMTDLMEAARKEPKNRDVRKELEKAKVQLDALKEQQKGLFGGIFAVS